MSETFTLFDIGGQTENQFLAILGVRIVSASCSIMGSLFIIWMSWRKRRDQYYHRLMMVLSLTDVFSSSTFLSSSFVFPRESGYPLAVGSEAACTAAAFVYHTFYSMTSLLSAFLSITFVLRVRHNLQERQIAKHIEKWAYVATFVIAPIIPAVALSDQAFNVNPFVHSCSFINTPLGCTQRGEVCAKGGWASTLLTATNCLRASMAVIAIASVLGTYCTVLRIRKRQLQYSFNLSVRQSSTSQKQSETEKIEASVNREIRESGGEVMQFNSASSPEVTNNKSGSNQEPPSEDSHVASHDLPAKHYENDDALQAHRDLMRPIQKRSALYVLAYLNSIIWNGVARALSPTADWIGNLNEPGWMVMQILHSLFIPSQGAFNFIIYLNPSYAQRRREYPDCRWYEIVWNLLKDDGQSLATLSQQRQEDRS